MPTLRGEPGRLDSFVAAALAISRADVQRAIAEGRVAVDGARTAKSHRLAGGEEVVVDLRPAGELEREDTRVETAFEDEHLLVVSKPAGLLTHPTATRRTGTLVNRLLARGTPLSSLAGADRPGIVHRLDAGTSGLMIVAKDDETHAALADLFRRHAVDRRYLALVRGRVEHELSLIEAPLARDRAKVRVRSISGKEAATEIEVRERFPRATFVEARPRTGRTHQIRVHLASAGHPILGDRAYGGGGDYSKRLGLERPFLHSWRIAFDHPSTGRRVELQDALPLDLQTALERARAGS